MSVFTTVSTAAAICLQVRCAGPVETDYRGIAALDIAQARTLIRHLTESIALATARRTENAAKHLKDAEERLRRCAGGCGSPAGDGGGRAVMRQTRACGAGHWFEDRRGESYDTFGPVLNGFNGMCAWRPPPTVSAAPDIREGWAGSGRVFQQTCQRKDMS